MKMWKWLFDYRKLVWCVVAIFLEELYYGLAVVMRSILVVGPPLPTISWAVAMDDTEAVLLALLGLIYIAENLFYYYVFGAKFNALQPLFTVRFLLWGVSMFFGVLTLIVRTTSPTNAHVAIAATFFGVYMIADVIAQVQRIAATHLLIQSLQTMEVQVRRDHSKQLASKIAETRLEIRQRIVWHAAEILVWAGAGALGAAFSATLLPVVEYLSLGVALMLGLFKCLD